MLVYQAQIIAEFTYAVSYNSYVEYEMQQCRMVTGRLAHPKCLFYPGTQNEKDGYTLIEHSVHQFQLFPTAYSFTTSYDQSIAIAVYGVQLYAVDGTVVS